MIKLNKNKLVMSVLGMFGGLAFAAIGAVIGLFFKGREIQSIAVIAGFCAGLGGLLTAINLVNFINYMVRRNNPKFRHAQDIALKDERMIIITDKAYAKADIMLVGLLMVVATIFSALRIPLYVTLILNGLVVINFILVGVFSIYYDKRL